METRCLLLSQPSRAHSAKFNWEVSKSRKREYPLIHSLYISQTWCTSPNSKLIALRYTVACAQRARTVACAQRAEFCSDSESGQRESYSIRAMRIIITGLSSPMSILSVLRPRCGCGEWFRTGGAIFGGSKRSQSPSRLLSMRVWSV